MRFNKVRDRQVGKFNRLLYRISGNINSDNSNNQAQGNLVSNSNGNNNNNLAQGSNISNGSSKWVVNLSSIPLTTAQTSLLSKGPNFALVPTNPPNVEFISVVEAACQRLSEQEVQELRAEVGILLKRAKLPKSNISREEKKALNELREDQERMVLIADKEVAMVVIDRKDYQEKVEGFLASTAYKSISKDPTNKFKVQQIQKLRRIKGKPTWMKVSIGLCIPLVAQPHSFMGYQKFIKMVPPLRPMVSSRGSVTYGVAKVIAKVVNLL